MAEDLIRYDILTQEALRGVVRKVLAEVAKTGLPGEHHFFISFVTQAPGVRISQRLLDQYDKEMTIVLQNQFWDLKVTETGFEVGLSFDGQPEMLVIPFSAIKGFFDPSVQFGLQFDAERTRQAPASRSPRARSAADRPRRRRHRRRAETPGEKVVSLDASARSPDGLEKRSLTIAGHRTSLALEPEFWAGLEAMATDRGQAADHPDRRNRREPAPARTSPRRCASPSSPGTRLELVRALRRGEIERRQEQR